MKPVTILAWVIVYIGWLLYGLTIVATLLNPRPSDPIKDITEGFKPEHWRFHIVALVLIILYFLAWGYTQKDKYNGNGTDGPHSM